jgi:hypothetical protein
MQAHYLLRFDDICPAMNWRVWAEIEELVNEKGIRPILAVVPDNRDPKLMVDPPVADFWQRVRVWQTYGWSIALHGYQHVYTNKNPGILGLPTRQSEYAGLPYETQMLKLRAGLAIFKREGVRVDCWVAPSHSFDWTTVDLLAVLGVKVINDGLWPWPHTDRRGITWVPQQLWGRLRPMPPGVWTACYHHNGWNKEQMECFQRDLERFAPRIVGLTQVLGNWGGRTLSLGDRISAWRNLAWNHRARPMLARLFRRGGL